MSRQSGLGQPQPPVAPDSHRHCPPVTPDTGLRNPQTGVWGNRSMGNGLMKYGITK